LAAIQSSGGVSLAGQEFFGFMAGADLSLILLGS